MTIASALADIALPQLALVAAMALAASLIGGVAGYGTGALMPLVLVPVVGAEPVVPIIALSSLFTNGSRVFAYRRLVDWRRLSIVLPCAIPTVMLGAWGYSNLSGRGAMLVIGAMMIASVPLRRFMLLRGFRLGDAGLAAAATGWGVVVGGTSGAGIILISLLMAAGLQGAAVLATDAAISIVIGIVKISVFGVAGAMTPQTIAMALLIGLIAFPGAFAAKALVERMPLAIHTAILDAVVIFGGAVLVLGAFAR